MALLDRTNRRLARLEIVKLRAASRTKRRIEQIEEDKRLKELEAKLTAEGASEAEPTTDVEDEVEDEDFEDEDLEEDNEDESSDDTPSQVGDEADEEVEEEVDITALKRPELEEVATKLGIADVKNFKNKDELIEAIQKKTS